MLRLWHGLRLNYYLAIADGCIEEGLKEKLLKKAKYHQMKINTIQAS